MTSDRIDRSSRSRRPIPASSMRKRRGLQRPDLRLARNHKPPWRTHVAAAGAHRREADSRDSCGPEGSQPGLRRGPRHQYGPNSERGVYRSPTRQTWEKVPPRTTTRVRSTSASTLPTRSSMRPSGPREKPWGTAARIADRAAGSFIRLTADRPGDPSARPSDVCGGSWRIGVTVAPGDPGVRDLGPRPAPAALSIRGCRRAGGSQQRIAGLRAPTTSRKSRSAEQPQTSSTSPILRLIDRPTAAARSRRSRAPVETITII
jgi:hypothetical protein